MRNSLDRLAVAANQKIKEKKYWLNKLSGRVVKSSLTPDYPPSVQGDRHIDSITAEITGEIFSRLIALCKGSDNKLNMILTAGIVTLLYKYTGSTDIVVGTTIYKQAVKGQFTNTALPIRNQLHSRMTFKELLLKVSQTLVEALENQSYPMEILMQQLENLPAPGVNSLLFDIVFLLKNLQDEAFLESIQPNILFLFLRNHNDIKVEIKYNSLVYKKTSMRRIALHFSCLLADVLADVNKPLCQIEILSKKEKEKILYVFNDTAVETSDWQPMITARLLNLQAIKTPGKIAVLFEDQQLTYCGLDQEAECWAQYLLVNGVSHADIVGIMMERSLELMVSIAAVLKTGAAYLPIAPRSPAERINYMLKDSSSNILLTSTRAGKNPFQAVSRVISVEELRNSRSQVTLPLPEPLPLNPAYILYTSGTTGKPKGVIIENRSLVNFIIGITTIIDFKAVDVLLSLTEVSFDIFSLEAFVPLVKGAKLVIGNPEEQLNPQAAASITAKNSITILQVTPSRLQLLFTNHDFVKNIKRLRYLLIGGEALLGVLLKQARKIINGKIYNLYGPTETTIWSTAKDVTAAPSITIGKPMANTKVYMVDKNNFLQPIGIPGELLIAGQGVARGYLNRPELTAEKFIEQVAGAGDRSRCNNKKFLGVQNPFFKKRSAIPTHSRSARCRSFGGFISKVCRKNKVSEGINKKGFGHRRLYKTGDLARWLPDGDIEFMGRFDYQVKIRGYRIETEEIETKLMEIPYIKETVVIARKDWHNGLNLYAYLVSQKKIIIPELRNILAKSLPAYMIPSYFLQVERIPLTPNGKVDRNALCRSEELPDNARVYTAPRNHIENEIASVWQKVLSINKIGIFDNLFEMGGNSLQVIRIVSHLIENFDITINQVFKYQTIADLASVISWKKDNLRLKIRKIRDDQETARQRPVPGPESLSPQYVEYKKEYDEYQQQILREKFLTTQWENKDKHILLTGATGYLGAHLLYELVKMEKVTLYLPVRGETVEKAKERLKNRLIFYFGNDFYEANHQALKVLKGDLKKKYLGLESHQYKTLSGTVATVIHSAANVSHFGNYSTFYEDNVVTTEKLLQFALERKDRIFHHISTLSVGSGNIPGKEYVVFNEFKHDLGQQTQHVYSKSKIEAEKKVLLYRNKGLNASIYRMGNLIFHSQTGRFQENIANNAFYANLKTFVLMGCIPDMEGISFDVTFIDHAARATVLLMTLKNLCNETFHIRNFHFLNWKEMVPFLRQAGIHIRCLSLDQFIDRLFVEMDAGKNTSALQRLLLHSGLFEKEETENTKIRVITDRTQMILKKLGFTWPEVNETHIIKMVAHCREVGFF